LYDRTGEAALRDRHAEIEAFALIPMPHFRSAVMINPFDYSNPKSKIQNPPLLDIVFLPLEPVVSMPLSMLVLHKLSAGAVMVFDALNIDKGPLPNLIYSLALVAMVFLPRSWYLPCSRSGGQKSGRHMQSALDQPRRPIGLLQSLADASNF